MDLMTVCNTIGDNIVTYRTFIQDEMCFLLTVKEFQEIDIDLPDQN